MFNWFWLKYVSLNIHNTQDHLIQSATNFLGWDDVLNLTEEQWKRDAIGRISSYFLRNILKSFATEIIKW